MIYRIVFCPKIGAWQVQFQRFYFFWVSACAEGKPRTFSNYNMAVAYIKSMGIDTVYRDWADRPPLGYGSYENPYQRKVMS